METTVYTLRVSDFHHTVIQNKFHAEVYMDTVSADLGSGTRNLNWSDSWQVSQADQSPASVK